MHLARGHQQHQRGRRGGQGLHEREVHRDIALGPEPGPPVAGAQPGEPGQVDLLPPVRLGDPQAGDVLLEVGVHRGDLLPRLAIGPCGLDPEHQRRHHDQRDQGQHGQAEPEVDDQQRDHDAGEGQGRVDHGDQPGLQERRQRVHVGGHPGHDAPGHLVLVEVQAEPLQLGEDLHPQRVQDTFAVAPDDHGLDRVDDPVGENHGQREARDQQHGAGGLGLHAVVDAAADQRRHGQAGQRVERVQHQADDEAHRERAQHLPQPERGTGPGPADVHAGHILAGGSASTFASSSGDAGMPAIMLLSPAHRRHRGRRSARGPRPGRRARRAGQRGQAGQLGRTAGQASRRGRRGSVRRRGRLSGPESRRDGVPGRRGGRSCRPRPARSREPVGVGALGIVTGPGDQLAKQRAARLQLGVRADVNQAALVEDRDPVGELEGGPPVRDEQRGPASA